MTHFIGNGPQDERRCSGSCPSYGPKHAYDTNMQLIGDELSDQNNCCGVNGSEEKANQADADCRGDEVVNKPYYQLQAQRSTRADVNRVITQWYSLDDDRPPVTQALGDGYENDTTDRQPCCQHESWECAHLPRSLT